MATNLHPDIELGRVRDGYPALAKWIAQDPDEDPLVFRKFGRVGARSLLHLQCRLVALEHELDDLDEEARCAQDVDTKRSLQRWETLVSNAKTAGSVEDKIVRKLDEFEELLKRYYEMLALRSQIAQLSRPADRVLDAYKDFLSGAALGGIEKVPRSLIYGRASTFLEDKDDLNHWLLQKRSDPLSRTTRYKNSHIVHTVSALDLVLAAIMLVGAIVNFYLFSSPDAKLGLIAMYTVLFALSMFLYTNASRAEVFAATAAYAAVLVVFVSGDLGGKKSEMCLIQLEGAVWKTVRCPG